MRDAKGRGVVRLGDRTSHGGEVISACESLRAMGRPVALDGATTICPQCGGSYPITVTESHRRHHGKPVAYDGDLTACGAKLISSI